MCGMPILKLIRLASATARGPPTLMMESRPARIAGPGCVSNDMKQASRFGSRARMRLARERRDGLYMTRGHERHSLLSSVGRLARAS